ncbi:MAG: hypothetical protein MN733_41300, partial [Nitrososphaera sp.]|nr:hypothetical protein [Nitrososphaera sp.]
TDARADIVGAGILGAFVAGGIAAEVAPLVVGSILSNPVRTNEIGNAIADAMLPGAENVTSGVGEAVAKALPPLRQQYIDAVTELGSKIPAMREAGMSSEQIARSLHGERRALGETFKDLTPSKKLQEIYERNVKLYGDRLGPSIEWLRAQGKSWEDIIESAKRPGGKDLGF